MRKIYGVGLAILALVLFGAFSATSAFAVSKFLFNGAEITADLLVEIAGELLLEDTKAPVKDDVLCSGIFDGLIEPGGVLGFINEVLDLTKELLAATVLNLASTEVTGDDVECLGSSAENCLVVALNLPWHVEIELAGPVFRLDFLEEAGKQPEYYTDCETFLGLVEDVCDGLSSAVLTNAVGGVLAEFNTTSQKTACSLGGAESGVLESESDSIITDVSGGELSLSE